MIRQGHSKKMRYVQLVMNIIGTGVSVKFCNPDPEFLSQFRHLELFVLRGGLVHWPQCLQPLPTWPLPAPKWATILPALLTGVLHQALLFKVRALTASQGALCVFPAHQDILLMSLGLQPAEPVSEAILAPSKMQLFVCLASQDHFATPAAARPVSPAPAGRRLLGRRRRAASPARQLIHPYTIATILGFSLRLNCAYFYLGTFKGPSDNRCKACRTGEYQLQRGKESCELCPENHYCPSPDVKPVKCPPDAFCPRGSVEPSYCMELFLYKAGESCQLTPATVIVLATFSAGGIFVVFLIILRRRQEHGTKSLKSLLLPRGSGHATYGGTEHTEPVYAGW
ncbi:hypothetical protein RLOC_00004302 [Lonchura striata]|uniref:Tyrosine-protein kinase ephrin type A/B receptor-like domain-containing protein n=1 Tax=Lonchura striata TaxID=40157 RepID=A0A218V999_9PASE|nr:hypothetical protein RLOC_00004302 [Lonchura striata domestica]